LLPEVPIHSRLSEHPSKVKTDASAEELKKCAEFSPVLDVITHGTPVSLRVEKA
jgi:hypothetical protein